MQGSVSFPKREWYGYCPLSLRFILLLAVAFIGAAIVAIMMSVNDVRSVISYKKTSCEVLDKTLEVDPFNPQWTRGVLNVTYVRIYNSTTPSFSLAYKGPKSYLFYKENQQSWLDKYQIGSKYDCFYNEAFPYNVAMDVPIRVLIMAMVGLAGSCMLVVPIVVLVITLKKEGEAVITDTGAMFTPQASRSENDPLITSASKKSNSAHIQARYSTDGD